MTTLRNKLSRLLPAADLEGGLALPDRPGRGGELRAGADVSGADLRGQTLKDLDLTGLVLHAPLASGGRWEGLDLSSAEIAHARLEGLHLADCHLAEARLTLADASGAHVHGGTLAGATLTGVGLRDAHLTDVDCSGASFVLCDLFGSTWSGVDLRGARLRGSDLSFTTLDRVDLRGADLRGACLAWATVSAVELDGARVEGADLRGVRGLTEGQRKALLDQGARLQSGWLEAILMGALRRAFPGWSAERADRVARGASLGMQLLGVLALLGLTFAVFRDRVVAPPDPRVEAEEGEVFTTVREPTEAEITRTRESFTRLKAALQVAYEVSGRYGVATWPSLEDLSENLYDRDGSGPGTERVTLVEGGLPPNLLTAGEGVLPYCNEVAAQETISGDDSDWHYCDQTGRLFACGGFTEVPTLGW